MARLPIFTDQEWTNSQLREALRNARTVLARLLYDAGPKGLEMSDLSGLKIRGNEIINSAPDPQRSVTRFWLENQADPQAVRLLRELRSVLQNIRPPHPAYAPGTEPTAADNLKNILDMMEFGLKQIEVYMKVPNAK